MKKNKILLLAPILALTFLISTISGCFGTPAAVPAGWAGVAAAGDNLYTVSGTGQLYSMSAGSNGNITASWNSPVDNGQVVNVFGAVAVSGNRIYVAGYNGKVYAFDAATGQSVTSVILDSDDPKPIVGGIAADGNRVYVASSNGWVYALDSTTLEQLWKFRTGREIWSTPVVDQDTVFIGSFDKKFYALDTATGAKKWEFTTQGAIMASSVVADGTIYVASFDRHIYALDEASGAVKWQYPASGTSGGPRQWFWATPVISENTLFAPCLDGKVYGIDLSDPTRINVFDLGEKISSAPVVVDGQVIVVTHDGKVFSLSANGTQMLIKELKNDSGNPALIDSALLAVGETVYTHALNPDRVYALNISSKELHSLALDSTGGSSVPAATVTITQTVTTTK